jgi:hypothetical protein
MNHQTSVQSPTTEAAEILEEDMLLALVHSRVARLYVNSLGDYQQRVPSHILNACMRTSREIGELERKILSATPRTGNWLRKEINKDKIMDVASVTELILRLGKEEKPAMYEELLSLIIDVMDTVFYTQKARKNIHFPKYKAMFKMITNELKMDVAGQQGQVIYRNGEIFLRTASPDTPNEIA